jgi:hypothetical protein
MNWEAIGAVGEIVGAIAVVITLAYLSVQIRQSTRSTSVATLQSIFNTFNSINSALASNVEASTALVHALNDPDGVAPEQEISAFFSLRCYMNCLYQMFELNRLNAVEDEMWHNSLESIAELLRTPGGRIWLETRSDYPPVLVDHVKHAIGERATTFETTFKV